MNLSVGTDVVQLVQQFIRDQVVNAVDGPGGASDWDFEKDPGDPGLMGPDSIAWRVHADFPATLVGGVAALMLQTLHPLAMAGVDDHSGYLDDPFRRLRRTGAFVATTTYASAPVAHAHIEVVKRVHSKVVGVAPDGRAYQANDPELLCWVHTCEMTQFLAGYQRYAHRRLSGDECDQYLREVAVVPYALGAPWVPTSRAEVDDYFLRVRPQLFLGSQAKRTMKFLLGNPGRTPFESLVFAHVSNAACALLPNWAASMLKLQTRRALEPITTRGTTLGLMELLRWGLGAHEQVRDVALRRALGDVSADQASVEI